MRYGEYKKIPNRLREKRLASGFRQQYVARVLGLKSTSKLSRWENGICLPNLVNAFKLSGLYGALVDQLFQDLRGAIKREIMVKVERLAEEKNPQP